MKLFEIKTTILIIVLLVLIQIIAMNSISPYISINYGLKSKMLFDAILDLIIVGIIVFYAFVYIWKWNKGEAKLL